VTATFPPEVSATDDRIRSDVAVPTDPSKTAVVPSDLSDRI